MKRMMIAIVAAGLALAAAATRPVDAQKPQPKLAAATQTAAAESRRPNIVVILGDDMGFSDMGLFGSEIRTPNLDGLARDGVRFTNFYTHASCSPTRSMLLSGVDTHVNGIGNMDEWTAPNQVGVPGYEGYLNDRVVTLPQLLKSGGYHTYMVGKWHMGKAPDQIPAARGFERDFSLLDGAGSYWNMDNMTAASPRLVFTEDGRYLTRLPKDYYATKTYTDKLIGFIDANRGDGKPFFAYVAHQAPHDPFHLPKEWRDRHVGEYDKGWDVLRQERLKRQIELGIVPAGTTLAERMWIVPDPTVLAPATRAILGRKMELYAGMMENMDFHVGRLIAHLKEIGEFENTVFIVFGDNGAEGADLFGMITGTPGTRNYLFAASKWSKTDPKSWGEPGSYPSYGPGWAQVSMTPFSQYKGMTAEGGIRNALVVSGPVVKRPKGSINRGQMHVADIMPTLLEWAGVSYPRAAQEPGTPPAHRQVVDQDAGWGGGLAADGPGLHGVGDLRQPGAASRRLEAALAVAAVGHGRLGALQRGGRSRGAEKRRRGQPREGQGAAGALGRVRQGEQRDHPQSIGIRELRGQDAAALPGRHLATRRSST